MQQLEPECQAENFVVAIFKVKVTARARMIPNSPFSCRLRDHHSIYTVELQAILFALKQSYQSQEKKFMIFSDSLSASQVLGKYIKLMQTKGKLFLCQFLDMLIFEETRLLIEPTADLMPFSDLKPLTAK